MTEREQIRVDGKGNVVVGRDLRISVEASALPPDGQGRTCPQCTLATWPFTQHCIHCGLDLFAHDLAVHRGIVERRFAIIAVSAVVAGLTGLGIARMLPQKWSTWVTVASVLCLLLAAAADYERRH